MSRAYTASDYAGMSAGKYSFYYGYEELVDDTWAFVVTEEGKGEVFRMAIEPQSVNWDCGLGLLEGIGEFLAKDTTHADK